MSICRSGDHWLLGNNQQPWVADYFYFLESHHISDSYFLVSDSARHTWDVPISVVNPSYLKVSTSWNVYIWYASFEHRTEISCNAHDHWPRHVGQQSSNLGTLYSTFRNEKLAPSYLLWAAGVHVFVLLVQRCHHSKVLYPQFRRAMGCRSFEEMCEYRACSCYPWCIWSGRGFGSLCFAISDHFRTTSWEKK